MPKGGARARVDVDRTVTLDRADTLRGSADRGLFADLEPGLFCVDGNNLLWRAAHGYPAPFTAEDGRELTPLFRFFTMLRRALGTHGLFAECVVCFDGPEAWARRAHLHAGYKANRTYEDVDLGFMGWLPEIRAALDCCAVTNIELTDEEADDVIATLGARSEGRAVRILSTDRDFYQLVSPSVLVLNPRARPAAVNADVVRSRFGVEPSQWCDFRALAGDPSDGIPGLHGIGPKRAAALLAGGRTLDDLRDELPEFEDALRWRELVRLRSDVALDVDLRAEPTPTLPPASVVCRELGLIS